MRLVLTLSFSLSFFDLLIYYFLNIFECIISIFYYYLFLFILLFILFFYILRFNHPCDPHWKAKENGMEQNGMEGFNHRSHSGLGYVGCCFWHPNKITWMHSVCQTLLEVNKKSNKKIYIKKKTASSDEWALTWGMRQQLNFKCSTSAQKRLAQLLALYSGRGHSLMIHKVKVYQD